MRRINPKLSTMIIALALAIVSALQAEAQSGLITLVTNPNPTYPGPNSVISAVLDPATGTVTGEVMSPISPTGTTTTTCQISMEQVKYLLYCEKLKKIRRMKAWDLADALAELHILTIDQLNKDIRVCSSWEQDLILSIMNCLAV